MQIIGILLILVIVGLFAYYFKWSRSEERAQQSGGEQRVTVVVKGAYSPNTIRTKVDEPLHITFDRQEDSSCSKKVIFSDFGISEELPDFGKKEIVITPTKAGEYLFSCEMGMYQGKVIVE